MKKIFSFEKKEKKQRPFGNFHEWPLKELIERERGFGAHDMHAVELRAEIKRRHDQKTRWITVTSVVFAAISAIASMVAAIASLLSIHAK